MTPQREVVSHRDIIIALLIILVLASIYFASVTGVVSTNDGSHYALLLSMGQGTDFEIDSWLWYTGNQDYATYAGRVFSDRPPGTALLTLPYYWLADALPEPVIHPPSVADAENTRLIYVILSSVIAMSSAAGVAFLMFRYHFAISEAAAIVTIMAAGLGTTMWRYGSLLYSHSYTLLIVVSTLYLLFEVENKRAGPFWMAVLLGTLLGLAPVVEYQNVLFSTVCGIYLVTVLWRSFWIDITSSSGREYWLLRLGGFLIGASLPLGFLLTYNILNFGGPFELSMYYVDLELWPNAESFGAQFSTPVGLGLTALLIGDWFLVDGGVNQGLFLLSPVAILGLPGLMIMIRRTQRNNSLLRALFSLGIFVGFLILFASYAIYNPSSNDSRYLTSFILLWFIPVGFFVAWFFEQAHQGVTYLVSVLAVFGLIFLSLRNHLWHIAFYWGYNMDLTTLQPRAITPDNVINVLQTVFPNMANVPLIWLYVGGVSIVAVGLVALFKTATERFTAGK